MVQLKPEKGSRKLYKYRAFNNLSLDALIDDRIFFADPSTFNDPLDTRPSLETDIDADALEAVLVQLVEQRVASEMEAAAKTIRYKRVTPWSRWFRLCASGDQGSA